jgi:putative ABC transport system ATP-binding protein
MKDPSSKPIIELKNIFKVFKVKSQDVTVLKNVDLSIDQKDFSILFGPSGCGKSTLLHIMLGLETPTSGSARFLNTNLYDLPEDERSEFRKKYVGMIYQQPNWIKSLTVLENVAFACSLMGEDKLIAIEKAKKNLDLVGMSQWADYLPAELSSGQQQKVSLARALVTDPQIIIADEPTGNLDYVSGLDLMRLLKTLVEDGKTVIMVTHDINNINYGTKLIQIFDGFLIKVHDLNKVKDFDAFRREITSRNISTPSLTMASRLQIGLSPAKSKASIFSRIKKLPFVFRKTIKSILHTFNFAILLTIYLVHKPVFRFRQFRRRLFSGKSGSAVSDSLYYRLIDIFGNKRLNSISRVDLIDLSLKNMFAKLNRTLITVGGMAIGIGAIVFLVSVGYGLENLVVKRVARLEEMRQVDAAPAVASNVRITDKTLEDFKAIPGVAKVLPIIGVVGKISYNQSNTDIAVYGVMADYLQESAIKPSQGKIFTSNDLNLQVNNLTPANSGQVAGASTDALPIGEYQQFIHNVNFNINTGSFIRVRQSPGASSELIGYTRRAGGVQSAGQYWGKSYDDNLFGRSGLNAQGEPLGYWLKAEVPLWEIRDCQAEPAPDCENGKFVPQKDSDGNQLKRQGYFAALSLDLISGLEPGDVLGETSPAALVDLASLEATPPAEMIRNVDIPSDSPKEVVVNQTFLKILNIAENKAIGQTIPVSLIAVGSLTEDSEKIVSSPALYTIVGVTNDSKSPVMYLPIINLKQMGISTYSQAKVVISDQSLVTRIRRQIEVMGFKTSSVVDTVNQIERLFSSVRVVLGLLGAVALAVAALGMFNTLTVSLLERTHEVGMMKTMGMKSTEVEQLFLTESMIMGVFGGVSGLIFGVLIGKLISVVLSAFAVIKGIGFIDITYIPPLFTLLILGLSLVVGFITGIYPSRRATKISALDALRYE